MSSPSKIKDSLKHLSLTAALLAAGLAGVNANALTLPSKVCLEAVNPGTSFGNPSFFDILVSGGTSLDGVRDGWCIDGDQGIGGGAYTANVFDATSPGGQALVSVPGNVDLVTWLLNQTYIGLPSLAGGNFTYGDIQRSIWSLIDSTAQTEGLGDWSQGRVDEIVALALANGNNFVAACGQQALVFLQPVATACDLSTGNSTTLGQPIVTSVPADCPPPPPVVATIGNKVWKDIDLDGVQGPLDQPFSGVTVELRTCAGAVISTTVTDANGLYLFANIPAGSYQIRVVAPANWAFVAPYQGAPDIDSDVDANTGITTCIALAGGVTDLTRDAGLYNANPTGGGGGTAPGTGTIGYWKTHPEAWTVPSIVIGGVTYTKDQAISMMWTEDKTDKRGDLFRQLVAAKLNVIIGNNATCIAATIAAADTWWATYRGSLVKASSKPWQSGGGGALMTTLDNYNNGRLCAPHRN